MAGAERCARISGTDLEAGEDVVGGAVLGAGVVLVGFGLGRGAGTGGGCLCGEGLARRADARVESKAGHKDGSSMVGAAAAVVAPCWRSYSSWLGEIAS